MSQNEIQRIDDQIRRAFEGPAWHGPAVKEVLLGVDAKLASARPIAKAHSIWEITLHINIWHVGVRKRLQGEIVDLSLQEEWPPADSSQEAWNDLLRRLQESYDALRKEVLRHSDEELSRLAPGSKETLYATLHGLIQHDLFHAGQIAVFKKSVT
ncbi:MAG: hypothetical protein C5B54_07400 [Acidobacteria bacterium]|nr:MAG: hypothetical protein C5B54_07400 [Acidobacteriota bacterium]